MNTVTRKIASALARALDLVTGSLTRPRLGVRIGQGGMGEVYRGRFKTRDVAVKVLASDRTDDDACLRFEREARVTRQLTSPNIVEVYAQGTTWDGRRYYTMELVEGEDLDHLVRREGPLAPLRVIAIARQICSALVAIHAPGFVHRDIKPSNLALTREGVVKVFDFGLVQEPAEAATVVTGTPGYLAPEAILEPHAVDARADLYALGGVMYFLLTGTQVFEGASIAEVCSLHIHEPPEAPSERLRAPLPPALDALVLGLLAKDPAARPSTAEAVSAALDAIEVVPAPRESGVFASDPALPFRSTMSMVA